MHVHLVFVTTYRRNVSNDERLRRCEKIMVELCDSFEAELREFNGKDDRIHPLIPYPPKVALSRLVDWLKGRLLALPAQGIHRPRQPRRHARPFLVATSPPPAASTADHHQRPHRTTAPTSLFVSRLLDLRHGSCPCRRAGAG
ncbi:IS200/IS605 family transposase [Nonomuraea sp. NPDC059194]|uniref:IS200/IS605 family transposase n=1 Tax=Nonomuraea sp. NPDC059194 TaxID=3346764 RepID=UPI003684EE58